MSNCDPLAASTWCIVFFSLELDERESGSGFEAMVVVVVRVREIRPRFESYATRFRVRTKTGVGRRQVGQG